MQVQFKRSHHWPNVIAHLILGLAIMGVALVWCYFSVLGILENQENLGPGLMFLLISLLMLSVSLVLIRVPPGYLQELFPIF